MKIAYQYYREELERTIYGRQGAQAAHEAAGGKMEKGAGALSGSSAADQGGSAGYSGVGEFSKDKGVYSAWQYDGQRPCAERGKMQPCAQRQAAYSLQPEGADQGGAAA